MQATIRRAASEISVQYTVVVPMDLDDSIRDQMTNLVQDDLFAVYIVAENPELFRDVTFTVSSVTDSSQGSSCTMDSE